MGWFENLMPSRIKTKSKNQQVPDGLWKTCQSCGEVLYGQDLAYNLQVCPKCDHHMRIKARQRLQWLFDKDAAIVEIGESLVPVDFLKFKDSKRYKDRITAANKTSGENEALVAMAGNIYDMPVTAVAFEFTYMGGSMGSVVGERFVRAVEYAIEQRTPFICFSASGGARMQEGLTSLFQMAKTSASLTKLADEGLPYISVLTDPTMGGVSASLAMLGDLIIAEPNALIGFAGPRVIEQTVRETLPEGFQRSEFLIKKGAIDRIVDRRDMRQELASLLALLLNRLALKDNVSDETQITSSQEDFTLTSKESLAANDTATATYIEHNAQDEEAVVLSDDGDDAHDAGLESTDNDATAQDGQHNKEDEQ